MAIWDRSASWMIHPKVSVRPEPFGALLYHFETRQLSFLKDPELTALVQRLGESPSAEAALTSIPEERRSAFESALERLADTDMLVTRA